MFEKQYARLRELRRLPVAESARLLPPRKTNDLHQPEYFFTQYLNLASRIPNPHSCSPGNNRLPVFRKQLDHFFVFGLCEVVVKLAHGAEVLGRCYTNDFIDFICESCVSFRSSY